MKDYTLTQSLSRVHRELYGLIRLLRKLEVEYVGKSASWGDVVEVDKVLTATVEEVGKIIMREKGWKEKSLSLRQAEEFALKAKVAKAGEAAPAHRQLCPSDQSHK